MKKHLPSILLSILLPSVSFANAYSTHETPLSNVEMYVIKSSLLEVHTHLLEIEKEMECINFVLENHDDPWMWEDEQFRSKAMEMK